MQYRKFGRLDWQVSALGFGLAGLPPDAAKALKMLRLTLESGVNYLDIDWPFALKNNEAVFQALNKTLAGGNREKVRIAATIPAAEIKAPADFERCLGKILEWLQEEYIDFLLLGGLDRFTWPELERKKVLSRAEAALSAKNFGYLGFAFHDQYQFLRDVLEAYDGWALARFQYSFMDIDHHPGVSGLQLAAARGLGVVVAQPLLGGRLTKNIPPSVADIWAAAEPQRPPAAWALRWVWNLPEVGTVVGDVSTLAQVRQNVALAGVAQPDGFIVPEELVVSQARDAYRALKPIPCTACRGCMPCPQGIDVPRIFEIYNDAAMYGDNVMTRAQYRREKHNLDACTGCGVCANVCGKKIPITDWLKKARALLSDNN